MKNLKSFKVFENEQEKKESSKKEEVLKLAYEWQESGHYDGYSLPELIEMAQKKLGKN